MSETGTDFTNRGKAEIQQTPARQAQRKKLTRVPFRVSRLMEFASRRELVNQTGHDYAQWPLVVLKELVDNALDACEEAGIAPVISVTVVPGSIVIEDNGPGIPAQTIEGILDYTIRVSSREAYVSPTRGAQGNALKTILPMAYVLDEHHGEDASGKTTIEVHGIAHLIEFSVDHVRQEPKITHTTAPSPVVVGTKVTVRMARQFRTADTFAGDIVGNTETSFLRLASAYAWINPHLSLKVTWQGEVKIDFKASNPTWKKWLPSWPTSPHWYDKGRFRRYMAAHIANRGSITVREFISEFDGMSGTAKQKAVLAATGASRVPLHDFFGRSKVNSANIEKLLAALKVHTKPVRAASLGVIGKDHFFRMMEAAGGDPKTFNYQLRLFETDGVPHVVEFAFGVLSAGLNVGLRLRGLTRITITGVNGSPGINNPFRQIGHNGAGLDTMLAELHASATEPVIAALHLFCPRVTFTDRGKSAIVIDGEAEGIYHDEE
jgi:DNA topoisomerase VI subunit B